MKGGEERGARSKIRGERRVKRGERRKDVTMRGSKRDQKGEGTEPRVQRREQRTDEKMREEEKTRRREDENGSAEVRRRRERRDVACSRSTPAKHRRLLPVLHKPAARGLHDRRFQPGWCQCGAIANGYSTRPDGGTLRDTDWQARQPFRAVQPAGRGLGGLSALLLQRAAPPGSRAVH